MQVPESRSSESSTPVQNCNTRRRIKTRKSHTKSRNGCHTCKLRRVKCDEARPVCGACSSRGSLCSFPEPSEHTSTNSSTNTEPHPSTRPSHSTLEPLEFDVSHSPGPVDDSSARLRDLNMCDLRLLQYYLLNTAKKMSLNSERGMVWQRVIPDLASQNEFLMHLVLSLAGVHLLVEKALSECQNQNNTDIVSDADAVAGDLNKPALIDLQFVIEHHQKGLRKFQEELPTVSAANAEAVSCGSFLLVAFAFASLRLRDLGSLTAESQTVHPERPRLDWLHLIRGLTIVVGEHWHTLRQSRLRAFLHYRYVNDDWKFHPQLSTPSLPRLNHYAPRLERFSGGAYEAISNLRTLTTNTASMGTPTSMDSSYSCLSEKQDIHSRTIDVLEEMYMRILHVLHFSRGEPDIEASIDIEADMEDSAVTSWPNFVPREFIYMLHLSEGFGASEGMSYTILAHFYLIFALFENTWFLKGGFEKEISKINTLVCDLGDSQLGLLMRWPVEVIALE